MVVLCGTIVIAILAVAALVLCLCGLMTACVDVLVAMVVVILAAIGAIAWICLKPQQWFQN